jgi:galactan endo-1,6-beta-galactosidase
VLKFLRAEMDERGLRDMPIAASDESWYDWAVETWNSFDDAIKAIISQVNVHGYQGMRGRGDLLREITAGKRLWNTEFGDEGTDGILMARCISMDFTKLQPTAWCYWQPLDASAGWALLPADMKQRTIGAANPKYFVLAQYSRHIRPGMTILTTGDKEVAAARDPKTGRIVIVALNSGDQPRERVCDLSRLGIAGIAARSWLTETKGEARYRKQPDVDVTDSRLVVNLPPLSVQTFEIEQSSKEISESE